MTRQERIEAVERLGYSRREAVFLVLAALHSGYFLRRQFSSFVISGRGGVEGRLIDKLVGRGHARYVALVSRNHLFHLAGKGLYAAMGEEGHPNARVKPANAIRVRLIGLDYILANRDQEFLAGEQERLEYFRSCPGADAAVLPRKVHHHANGTVTTHYFAEDFPIGVRPGPGAPGGGATVSFCYVGTGVEPVSMFRRYVRRYRSLIESTDGGHVVFIAEDDRHFQLAHAAFDQIWSRNRPVENEAESQAPSLQRYFQLRGRYEEGLFHVLTTHELQQLRLGRDQFGSAHFEALFERWRREGDAVLIEAAGGSPEGASDAPPVTVSLTTWSPKQRFNLFGSVWGSHE
jgi:hypothetical protein